MNKIFAFCTVVFTMLLIGIHFVYAQEAPAFADPDWQVIEQCVEEPTDPPIDWHYGGTILFNGRYGIHGMRSEWDTPHVLAFTHITNDGKYVDIITGRFSPDKTLFVAAFGDEDCGSANCTGSINHVYSLRLFDVRGNNPRQYKTYPLRTFNGQAQRYNNFYVIWLNDHEILYPVSAPTVSGFIILLDINTGEQTVLEPNFYLFCPGCSPDRTRRLDTDEVKRRSQLIDLSEHQIITSLDLEFARQAQSWSSDSKSFIAAQRLTYETAVISKYDRDGNLLEQITPSFGINQLLIYRRFAAWSPNTDFLYLKLRNKNAKSMPIELQDSNYLFNPRKHEVYHLCDAGEHFQWSPDSRYLAFTLREGLMVYDVERLTTYRVFDYPEHESLSILDWRAD